MQWWVWVLIGVGAGALIMLVSLVIWFLKLIGGGFWN